VNEERRRARIAEEVNDAESVANEGLGKYTDVELEAMNQQLDKLRNEATSLRMPTRRIDQLKLQVSSAIGGTQKPQRTQQKGPGPRGKEKVRPVSKKSAKKKGEQPPISPAPTAIDPNSQGGEMIRRKAEEEKANTTVMTMGKCPTCSHEFALPIETIVNSEPDHCPNCQDEFLAHEFVNALVKGVVGPEGEPGEPSKGGPSRKGQGQGVKARPKPPKPGETRRKMSELFGE
jgi:hypothetical protein